MRLLFAVISIHAPREGSDLKARGYKAFFHVFQSTLPVRGATAGIDGLIKEEQFQSTLPVRGATAKQYKRQIPDL